ncbi:HAD family phosphatase [Nostoc sp. CHAB 5784]|uniref:HAD family hydrolase n=1 Tax=Nostoc mirabile TaxID=2907820 RepID=UPI001E65946E|nr:HAD family phosphatase [Nostoc mirabile]MCC5669939.1 HAD family phosphatase [Nostoc mirabile CHAB5784]
MSYTTVLFDMDGVIVDTQESVAEFWQSLATDHHVHVTQSDLNQHVYGCTAAHTLDALFPQFSDQQRQSIYVKLQEYESNLKYKEVPGSVALLQNLKRRGIRTALVTGAESWKASTVVQQLGIGKLLDAQVVAGDIRKGKPDPECYLLAAQHLKTPPHSCIVFEDAISGVKAAVAAGALCIGIQRLSTELSLLEAGAYCTVPDFTAVNLQVLSKLENSIKTSLYMELSAGTKLPLISSQLQLTTAL